MRSNIKIGILLISFSFSPMIFAEDAQITLDTPTVVGVIGQQTARYSGSNQNYWQVLPLLQMRKGAFFADTTKGFGYDLQTKKGLYFEHVFGYSSGRAEKNSNWREGANNLKGMGEIKDTLDTSLAIGWQIRPWLIPEIKSTMPLTQSEGSQFQASLTLIPLQTNQDILAIQGTVLAADSRYMNTYYGVNDEQHTRTGYQLYHSNGGLLSTQLNINWSHQFNKHWGSILGGSYDWLADKAANSPIVTRRNMPSWNLGISYTY